MDSVKQVTTFGFFSRLFFCWVLPILRRGTKHELTPDDLPGVIAENASRFLARKLERAWKRELKFHPERPSLLRALIRVFGGHFVRLGFVYFIGECVLKIGQGVVLGKFLEYFSGGVSVETAWLLGGGLILLSALQAFVKAPLNFASLHLGLKIRVACSALIYRKALGLSQSSLRKTSVGQMINLLSNDLKRLEVPLATIHAIWLGPVALVIVIYILWSQIGSGSLVGIFFLGIFVPFQGLACLLFGLVRGQVAQRTDARLRVFTEVLTGVKLIKMYAWELLFAEKVDVARKEELRMIRKKMFLEGVYVGVDGMSTRAMVLLTFLAYVGTGGYLSPEKVYVTLFLYNVSRGLVMSALPCAITLLAEINISVTRIQNILLLEARVQSNPHFERIGKKAPEPLVNLEHVCASWDGSGNTTLADISLQVHPGQLVAVVGAVGSGKSSLLEVVLGELPISYGSGRVEGTTVYSPQEPFVLHATIKENILFGLPLEVEWFETVVSACGLDLDLASFPQGACTLVGDKGLTLSEGQKARVNLARCVYARGDIYLLDDPLSAVDAKIGRLVFDQVIRGLLRDKVVILVTHQTHYLEDTADEILVLSEGKFIARGTYDQLKDKFLPQEILGQELCTETYETPETFYEKEEADDEAFEQAGLLDHGTIQSDETRSKGSVGLGFSWTYFRLGNSLPSVFFFIVLNILAQVLLSTSDYYLQSWTAAEESTSDQRYTLKWIYTSLVALTFVVFLSSTLLFFQMCTRSGRVLHQSTTLALLRAPIRFYELNPAGRILNRLARDMGVVDEDIPVYLFNTLIVMIQVIGSVVLVCVVSPWLILPSLLILLPLQRLRRFYLKTATNTRRMEAVARTPIFSLLSTSLSGMTTIRAFGRETRFREDFDSAQNLHSSVAYAHLSVSSWLSLTFDWLMVLYSATIVLTFILLHKSGAQVGLALSSVMTLTAYIASGTESSASLETQLVALERVIEYQRLAPEAPLKGRNPPEKWPFRGEIRMQNVFFSYRSQNENVLKDISFQVRPGEKVGIVGRTGAGKSTLMSVLYRFLEPSAGKVFIDDVDTSRLGLHDLRCAMFIIPQNQGFFGGSLRDNLDIRGVYSDSELWGALEDTQLTKRLKGEGNLGLATPMGDNGSNFSVGERQLICFARAILSRTKIVIFDEATASMDAETDGVIQRLIREKFHEATVLTIAHRLQTVMESDRICVLDQGSIVEFDEPFNLLQNSKGHLSELVSQGRDSASAALIQQATNAHGRRTERKNLKSRSPEQMTPGNFTLV